MPVLPLLPTSIYDFTQLIREDMLLREQMLFTQINPDWVDYSPCFPENLILEGSAMKADILRFMMEERSRQWWLATLTDRLTAIRKGRLHQYALREATIPTLGGTFRFPNSGTSSKAVFIQPGARIVLADSENPVTFRYYGAVALEIPAGSNGVATTEMEGAQLYTESFSATDDPNQELLLTQSPCVADASGNPIVSVTAGNGVFEAVQSFMGLRSNGQPVTADTRCFVAMIDHKGRLSIRFGNGIYGAKPTGTIDFEYKIGGGTTSVVPASSSWQIQDLILDETGQPVQLEFVNTAASTSAVDQETVGEARVLMPLAIRTNKRCITDDDYETAALRIAGVARAKLITSNHDSSLAENYGQLLLIAKGTRLNSGRTPTGTVAASLISEVEALYERDTGAYPRHMGFRVDVLGAPEKVVNIEVWIYKSSGYLAATVRTNIDAAIEDFFAVLLGESDKDSNGSSRDGQPNSEMAFGTEYLDYDGTPDYLLAYSGILNVIRDAAGVRMIPPGAQSMLLNGALASVTLGPSEWPVLGTVTVHDMDNSGAEI